MPPNGAGPIRAVRQRLAAEFAEPPGRHDAGHPVVKRPVVKGALTDLFDPWRDPATDSFETSQLEGAGECA